SAIAQSQSAIRAWLQARAADDTAREARARAAMVAASHRTHAIPAEAKAALMAADPRAKTKDSDYVFITFILTQLPHGAVGLLVAVMFAAALSSKASELAALGTTTTIDFWRHFRPLAAADEARNVRVARRFTALWGIFAVAFALFAGFAENLIEAINILGSIFYGVLLGLFLVAFFLRRVAPSVGGWGGHLGAPHVNNRVGPVIAFGQQPCGFFPRRFLVAKIRTARRLQAEIGGRVVYFCHDSDHDPRETRTILRHRATGQPAHLNFAVVSKLARKFSPLY